MADAASASTGPRGSHEESRRAEFPIQRAKIQRPPLRDDTLHRGRLLDWLSVNVHHRLVLLVAEAGYGKTTLLADFARRTRLRTLWFRVDDEDRDWVSVLNYLVAAGRELQPRFAPATADRLAGLGATGASRDELVRTFLGELIGLGDEPTALIVDDYHVLDESPDARSIIAGVLSRAPERFTLVLATRRRPALAIARLRALGEVAELATDDLRFTENETEELFRDTYQQPLEPDVLADLSRRTEGWAASLQLVRAAVRERSTTQVRAFVRALSGVDENLYDYLAEEVVGELEPAMQDFLMRTSILQVVDPILAEITTGVPQPDGRRLIESAERLGLLSRRGETSRHTVRYHPLVRDFLEDRLRRDVGDEAVRDLHRTVARHGESTDWRLAAYHYAAASQGEDVRRVIRDSFEQLLGRSEAEGAHAYLTRFGSDQSDPVRLIVESRLDYSMSRFANAASKARRAYELLPESSRSLRDVALFQLAAVQSDIGPAEECLANAKTLWQSASDPWLRTLARGVYLLNEASESNLVEVADYLEGALSDQRRNGLWHFAAVTLSNSAYIYRMLGDALRARRRAEDALDAVPPESDSSITSALHATLAWVAGVDADITTADSHLRKAHGVSHTLTRIEALIEGADIHLWYGSETEAERLLRVAEGATDVSYRMAMLLTTRAELSTRMSNFQQARSHLRAAVEDQSRQASGHQARVRYVEALLAARARDESASTALAAALEYCRSRGAHLFVAPLTLAQAVVDADGPALSRAVIHAQDAVPGSLSMVAELLVERLPDLDDDAVDVVHADVRVRPARWLPAVRNCVMLRDRGSMGLAPLLDQIGEIRDVPALRSFARTMHSRGADPGLGKGLARRLAPRVFVEDLGRVNIMIGERTVHGTDIRKKSLALLCFLLTRPEWSATKEQVVEALWPDGTADTSSNSLNQTLYFLRRVFDPTYKEDISAEYIHYNQELMWLDAELVQSRSAIALQALDRTSASSQFEQVETVVRNYQGRFALDFAYEEWASTFRDALHIRFLELVERTLEADAADGRYDQAIWLAREALDVDPEADELEALLVRFYRLAGSHVAAAEQYAHYAKVLRSTLGVEPPPFEGV